MKNTAYAGIIIERPLRFRVFDLEKRKIVYYMEIGQFSPASRVAVLNTELLHDEGYLKTSKKYVAVQSTGAFTAEDQPIYEGDVIEYLRADGETIRGVAEYTPLTGGFGVRVEDTTFQTFGAPQSSRKLRILGNIIENPELLNSIPSES